MMPAGKLALSRPQRRMWRMTMHDITNKRPGWVWVISLFYVFSAVWTCIAWYMVASRGAPTPQAKAYFQSMTVLDYGLMIGQALITLSAAVALVLLRKAACRLFCAALVIALISIAWHTLARGWVNVMQSMRGALFGALMGIALLFAVCFYTGRLREQGKLR